MGKLRHQYGKVGVRLFRCSRCSCYKQQTKEGVVYRLHATSPWDTMEPHCRDPHQADFFSYRPDDEEPLPAQLPVESHRRVPKERVETPQNAGDGVEARIEALFGRRTFGEREPLDGGSQDPVALVRELFPGAEVVEHDGRVFDGHVQLLFDEEYTFTIAASDGLRMSFQATEKTARYALDRYLGRTMKRPGKEVKLYRVDGEKMTLTTVAKLEGNMFMIYEGVES